MNLTQRIRIGLKCLPPKDYDLASNFLKNRNFESLAEIVESCFLLKIADDAKDVHKEKWSNINIDDLIELRANLLEYISYLDVPDNTIDYDEY